jgi:hypothetical protein
MDGLLPVMRLDNQLEKSHKACDTDKCPVERNEQCPEYESILPTFHTAEQIEIYIEEVPKNQTRGTDVEDRTWEQSVISGNHCWTKGYIDG